MLAHIEIVQMNKKKTLYFNKERPAKKQLVTLDFCKFLEKPHVGPSFS